MIDKNLEQYATDKQWLYYCAAEEHGSGAKAAEILGVNRATLTQAIRDMKRKATAAGYSPDHDWTHPVPDGQKVKGVSTYYDQEGNVKGQWVKSAADAQRQAEMFQAMVDGFTDTLPREEPTPGPDTPLAENLMACYPVGDHHMGMLAWHEETGKNYDLKISERLLMGAANHLTSVAPKCEQATVVFLGDFMHYDSMVAETPSSRNKLDADGRFPRMVRYAIRSMRYLVKRVLSQHRFVNIIVEIGNHDLSSSIFLMECLAAVYEFEDRVTVDTSPKHYHYFTFGATLVGTHHGHGAKMAQLPLIMAADQPEAWGASIYRYWWTGHVHHDQTKDYHGTKVESFRVLAPNDAWAQEKGYRAMQDMKCIILHSEFGEVSRYTVNPEMLK